VEVLADGIGNHDGDRRGPRAGHLAAAGTAVALTASLALLRHRNKAS
jgi:hypothetical protein